MVSSHAIGILNNVSQALTVLFNKDSVVDLDRSGPFWSDSDLDVWDWIWILALIKYALSTFLAYVKAINTVLKEYLLLNILVHKCTF
jgi:hypothetical protein